MSTFVGFFLASSSPTCFWTSTTKIIFTYKAGERLRPYHSPPRPCIYEPYFQPLHVFERLLTKRVKRRQIFQEIISFGSLPPQQRVSPPGLGGSYTPSFGYIEGESSVSTPTPELPGWMQSSPRPATTATTNTVHQCSAQASNGWRTHKLRWDEGGINARWLCSSRLSCRVVCPTRAPRSWRGVSSV